MGTACPGGRLGIDSMKIALDAMGGDFAPVSTVQGALEALAAYEDFELTLVGDEVQVRAQLAKAGSDAARFEHRIRILHTSQVVEMTDGAVEAIRRKKDSSLSRCIDLLKDGEADAAVSAGHTGAAVAGTKIKLRSLPGIDRPAIATLMPTQTGVFLLIDGGANTDCEPKHLVEFAIMGSIYAREVLGIANPRVGLLSNGKEPGKGDALTRTTHELLLRAPVNFIGNTEGHDLFLHPVDVVVCDGFVGNIVLKTSESLALAMHRWLKDEIVSSPIRMAGAWLARGAFRGVRQKTNTEEYGGMPLLGINGIWIKAHGNASPRAIRNALRAARSAVLQQVNPCIIEAMEHYQQTRAASTAQNTTATSGALHA